MILINLIIIRKLGFFSGVEYMTLIKADVFCSWWNYEVPYGIIDLSQKI